MRRSEPGTLQQTANFMRRKKHRAGFSQSEPEFLISCMDRHVDWAVIVCLVGGGQEINIGEAGIDIMDRSHPFEISHIGICTSHQNLRTANMRLAASWRRCADRQHVYFDDSLHLAVSMRSFRAENVSSFVKALLAVPEKRCKTSIRSACRPLSDRRLPRPATGPNMDSQPCSRNGKVRAGCFIESPPPQT